MNNKKLTSILVFMMTVIIMIGALCLPASAATAMSKTTVTYTQNFTYTGKNIKPTVTVKHGKKKLTKDKNYTVAYKNYKNVGKGTITITGKGSYTGKVTKYYYIKPKAVTNLKATAYAEKVKLTWSKVTGAKGYQVYKKVGDSWKKVATPTGTSYTVTGLEGATKYEFRVRAYAKAGDKTLYSSYKNISKTTTLDKPSALAISDITDNTAALSWKAVKGATSYRITLINTNSNFKRTLNSATNSIKLTNLDALAAYSVKVTALNVEKNLTGAESAEFTFSTAPASVKNLTAKAESGGVVNLSWTASFGASGYQVYYSKTDAAGNPSSFTKSSFVTDTTCSLSNLTPCSTYIFKVVATVQTSNGTAYSADAVSNKVTIPVTKVPSFKAVVAGADTVNLSWTRPTNIDGYKLYRDGTFFVTLSPQTTSYAFTELIPNTTYKFGICAFYGSVEGEITEATVQTAGDVIQSVTFNGRPSSLKTGGTYQLSVKVTPENASNKNVTFTSSDTRVATVSANGLITALKEGTTVIKATSVADPNKNVSFTLTVTTAPVEIVKVESITLDPEITIYEGDIVSLNPIIKPSNATDKNYTITGSDYTYQYKNVWLLTKTDTCKFSDYIGVYSGNLIKGKKATTEPKSEDKKPFYFTVTVTTSDGSNKTATTRIKVMPKMIDVNYNGMEDLPWYYGNTAQLTATLHSSLEETHKASDIRFKSSNTSVATVTDDGTVTCKGTGNVTITAYLPGTNYSGSFTFYSRGVVSVAKNYFEKCQAGKTYQLDARILPSSENDEIVYYSNNEKVATVDHKGLVTFKTGGSVMISVFTVSDPYNFKTVWLTSNTFTKPSGTNEQLLTQMKATANKAKQFTDMPSAMIHERHLFDNLAASNNTGATANGSTLDSLIPIIESAFPTNTTYLAPNRSTKDDFINNIPVKGKSYVIDSSLSASDVKSIKTTDNGDYYYEFTMVLEKETHKSLPRSTDGTRHGKVFDILTQALLDKLTSNTGLKAEYKDVTINYHDCSVTMKVNKVTGNIESMTYNMITDVAANGIKISAIPFTFNASTTYTNIITIDFSGYAQ